MAMNIAENLQLLLNTKESIRQAINEKAGDTLVESGAPFSAYSTAILSLCAEPDPCDIDPCSDPECPGYVDCYCIGYSCDPNSDCYDPVACGDCQSNPCVSPGCPEYDECQCEGTGCPDPCDEDPCSDPTCPGYDPCECEGPCASPSCEGYDECQCEGTGCDTCPESIPFGRYQFTLNQGDVIQVEAVGTESYFNPGGGCTPAEYSWNRTVYVYDSPTGTTPINTISVDEYKNYDWPPEDVGSNTNDNAGVVVWTGSGDYEKAGEVQTGSTQCDGVGTLFLHCETAGTYYFELSGYTSPRFWDGAGNEMTPECLQAYDWNLYVEDFGLDDGGVQFYDNDPHELQVYFGGNGQGGFTSAGTVPYGEYTIGLYDSTQYYPDGFTPEDCSISLNGATLTTDGSAWYWTAVSMMRFDDSSIAVFDTDGNLKLTTHITYGPI